MNFTKIIDKARKFVFGDTSNAFDQAAQQARQSEISRRQHFLDRSQEVDGFLNEYKNSKELRGLVDVEKCYNGKADKLERDVWKITLKDSCDNKMGRFDIGLFDHNHNGALDLSLKFDKYIDDWEPSFDTQSYGAGSKNELRDPDRFGVSSEVFARALHLFAKDNLQSFEVDDNLQTGTLFRRFSSGIQGADDIKTTSLTEFLTKMAVLFEAGPEESYKELKRLEKAQAQSQQVKPLALVQQNG